MSLEFLGSFPLISPSCNSASNAAKSRVENLQLSPCVAYVRAKGDSRGSEPIKTGCNYIVRNIPFFKDNP